MTKCCIVCGKALAEKYVSMRKYCSAKCGRVAYLKPIKNKAESTGSKGALCELIVCADLVEKGYYVFRCVSPNAPFDLVAYDANLRETLRVEVKSGYVLPTGTIICASKPKEEYYAHLTHVATVVGKEIYYNPPLTESKNLENELKMRV